MTGKPERTIPDPLPYASIKENLNEKFGYWKNAPSVLAACSTLNKAIREMGFKGNAATEVRETIKTIYSTTQEWGGGGPHGGRGGRGGPPRR